MRLILFLLFSLLTFIISAQTGPSTLTLYPTQDCFILTNAPSTPYPYHPDFAAISWTSGGVPLVVRSLMDFKFDTLPSNAQIIEAKLSLFAWNSTANGTSSNVGGSNESYLYRVTSPWNQLTTVWINQPTITPINGVLLNQSNGIVDYIDIDVTDLVKDIHQNISSSFGILIRLATEGNNRRLVFASSDHTDRAKHPKLTIKYSTSTNVIDLDVTQSDILKIYPVTIDKGSFFINNSSKTSGQIKLINVEGKEFSLDSNLILNGLHEYKVPNNLSPGMYFAKLHIADKIYTKKLIIK